MVNGRIVILPLFLNLTRKMLSYLSNLIEGVQRRATKLMVGSKLSYSDRLLKTGLISLPSRRIYLDLLFLFKCLHGQHDLDVSGYLQFYELKIESYNLRNTELMF